MAQLRINLFGEFRVWRDGHAVEPGEWGGQKSRALLKLLLTRPGRPFSRDEILEALWPGVPPRGAEHSLRTAVGLLRRALEPDLRRGPDSRYVLGKRPGYAFDPEAGCRVDAWEFEERRKKAEAAGQAGDLEGAIAGYRAALDLVVGDFLAEDPYEEWALGARENWEARRVSALSDLAECLARSSRYTEAVERCEDALALDGLSEDLHRRLMLYRYAAGEQALALETYRGYLRKLREEFGATPSPQLARLNEQIEARDVPGVDEGRRRYPRPRRTLKLPYSLGRAYFAGRREEYAWLAERLRETSKGRGGAVAVQGEAGVGKTRLAEEFLGYARKRDALVFSGRCYERELSGPLEPVLDTVAEAVDLPDTVAAAYGIAAGEPGNPWATARQESGRLYRGIAAQLVRLARVGGNRGLLLFVDDVQWADPATLEFLSYLSRRAREERILVMFSFRTEQAPELAPWLAGLSERRAVSTLSLERLSEADLAEMVSRMSSSDFADVPSLAGFLYRESEGNPFYAVEYLRWLIESGSVEMDDRRRIRGLSGGAPAEGTLPSGVRSLILARLDGLDGEVRGYLELAAVIGRSFALDLLSGVVAATEAEAFAALKPLLAAGLLVETSEDAYYLSHDKVRQAAYEQLDGPRCRELHLRVAAVLRRMGGEPVELAHHYLRARRWERALENLVLAAKAAEDACAWETALRDYSRALEVADRLPDTGRARFELLAARERLLERTDRRVERAETVEELLEWAERFGDGEDVAEACLRRVGAVAGVSGLEAAQEAARTALAAFRGLGDGAGEARTLRELGYVHWLDGNHAEALEFGFEALRLRRETGDRRGEAGDAWNIAQIYRGMGDSASALGWIERAGRLYGEMGDRFGEAMRAYVVATVHEERGELGKALSLELEGLRHGRRIGARHLNVAQHTHCGTLYLELGDPRRALEHFEAAARLAGEIGDTRNEGHSRMNAGLALERVEDAAGAAAAYEQAARLLGLVHEETGQEEDLAARADALSLLAAVYHHALDRPEEALTTYEAAARIRREAGDDRRLGEILLGVAGLRWRNGDLDGSVRSYESALVVARRCGEKPDEAAALSSLSRVHRDLGRPKESLRCGRRARALLEDLGDVRAEALVLASLAQSYDELGFYASSVSCLERSLRLRRELGDEEGEAKVLRYLGEVRSRMNRDGGNRRRVPAREARVGHRRGEED